MGKEEDHAYGLWRRGIGRTVEYIARKYQRDGTLG